MSTLQELHDSEINCGVKCFWDSCWTAWLGDDMNGIKCINEHLNTFSECEEWLRIGAITQYPDSVFAKAHADIGT